MPAAKPAPWAKKPADAAKPSSTWSAGSPGPASAPDKMRERSLSSGSGMRWGDEDEVIEDYRHGCCHQYSSLSAVCGRMTTFSHPLLRQLSAAVATEPLGRAPAALAAVPQSPSESPNSRDSRAPIIVPARYPRPPYVHEPTLPPGRMIHRWALHPLVAKRSGQGRPLVLRRGVMVTMPHLPAGNTQGSACLPIPATPRLCRAVRLLARPWHSLLLC